MSKIGTVIAMAGAGTVLGSLAYFGVAAAKGVSMREIPPLSWLSHEMPHAETGVHPMTASAPAPAPREEKPVVPPMTAGVLGAFVLPSPFDSRELQDLQKKLGERLAKIDATEKELARRASELDDWQKTLEDRTREIAELRTRTDTDKAAPPAAEKAGAKPDAAADAASWRAMAPLFEDGDTEELAAKLAGFEPDEAAHILKGLEPDRAAVLLNALPKAQYKPFLDAWRRLKD